MDNNKSIQGNSYEERSNYQLSEWVKGNSIHNNVDDQCCPDFSCCNSEFLADEEMRKTYAALYKAGRHDQLNSFNMQFLGNAIAKHYANKPIYITDGSHPNKTN